jgi:hypothetical protein
MHLPSAYFAVKCTDVGMLIHVVPDSQLNRLARATTIADVCVFHPHVYRTPQGDFLVRVRAGIVEHFAENNGFIMWYVGSAANERQQQRG